MAVPVLVIKLGCDGSLSIISAARSVGGGGFDEDDEVIVRLYNDGRSEQITEIKSPRRRTRRGSAGPPHGVVHATLWGKNE